MSNNKWKEFYSKIRSSSWPECSDIKNINDLPEYIVKEILSIHLSYHWKEEKLPTMNTIDYEQFQQRKFLITNDLNKDPILNKKIKYNDVEVYFNDDIDGAGEFFSPYYIEIIKTLYPEKKFKNVFEWCSGAGMIGFNILSEGLCQNLYLGDIYPPALEACRYTKQKLPDVYHNNQIEIMYMETSDDIDASLKFDLIVGNPPQGLFGNTFLEKIQNNRISIDKNFNVHRGFFQNIKKNLEPNGIILLNESSTINLEYLECIVNESGLQISQFIYYNKEVPYYFIEITHA